MDELTTIINDSPLSTKRKEQIKKVLDEKGPTEEVLDMLEKMLEDDQKEREKRAEVFMAKEEKEIAKIEKDYDKKKEALEAEVAKMLKKVSEDDDESLGVVWDQYQKGDKALQDDCLEKIKKFYSEEAINLIKEGF